MRYDGFDAKGLAINALLVALVAALVGVAAYVLSARQPERFDTSLRLSYASGPDLQALGIVDTTDNKVRLNTEAVALELYELAQRTSRAAPDLDLTADDVSDDVTA